MLDLDAPQPSFVGGLPLALKLVIAVALLASGWVGLALAAAWLVAALR